MADKVETSKGLLYALIVATLTGGSAPFWYQPLVTFVGPYWTRYSCGDTWLSPNQYQNCFEAMKQLGFFPERIEHKNESGTGDFLKAKYIPVSGNLCFETRHALTQEEDLALMEKFSQLEAVKISRTE